MKAAPHAAAAAAAASSAATVFLSAAAWTTAALLTLALGGCANVKPYEREKLADPIMNLQDVLSKQSIEQKLFSTREAGVGGGSGVGGGCGCAK